MVCSSVFVLHNMRVTMLRAIEPGATLGSFITAFKLISGCMENCFHYFGNPPKIRVLPCR